MDGRRACPGEVVTYTCTAIGVGILQWIAEPFLENDGTENNIIIYFSTDTGRIGQTVNCRDRSMQDCAGFRATLTNITNIRMMSGASVADMTSALTVTTTARLNETVVQCTGTTTTEIITATNAISVTGTLPNMFFNSQIDHFWYHFLSILLPFSSRSPLPCCVSDSLLYCWGVWSGLCDH